MSLNKKQRILNEMHIAIRTVTVEGLLGVGGAQGFAHQL
jgi:hypothetical protein